jgi:ssDNA-binding Zn-finger/Zn-ribbon topoisomerase 1
VDLGGGWDLPPQCECGGTFDADAMGRCPECGTMLTKEDIDYNQEIRCWD